MNRDFSQEFALRIEINDRSQIVRAWVIIQTVKRFLIISLVKLKIYKCKSSSFWACVLNKRVHITMGWLPFWRSIFIYIPQPKHTKKVFTTFLMISSFIKKYQNWFEMWWENFVICRISGEPEKSFQPTVKDNLDDLF